MNLPEQPPSTRPAAQPELLWWWHLESAAGEPVEVAGPLAEQRFPNRADAESWVGETWAELAELGVDAVSLLEGDRLVYGPMSLHA